MMRVVTTLYLLFLKTPILGNAVLNINHNVKDKNSSETCFTINDTINNFKLMYPIKDWTKYGFFTEEYLERINLHWLSFPPPGKSNHYFLAVLYIFVMTFGIFGNFMVVFMFLRCKSLRTPGNYLVMNLAVSDLLMMCKMPMFVYNSFYEGPALGDFACQMYGFLGGLTGTVSIVTLTAISLERYYVINYPLKSKFNHNGSKVAVVITWIYGISFSSIPLFSTSLGNYVPEGYLTSCSFDYLTSSTSAKKFIFTFFVAAWVLPVLLIGYSYLNIIYTVVRQGQTQNFGSLKKESFRHVREGEKFRQEIRVALIILFIIFLWFAAWTPYAVVALLGVFNQEKFITPSSSMIPALLAKSASAIDPYIYALTHTKFRAEIKTLFGLKTEQLSCYIWRSKKTVQPIQNDLPSQEDDVEIEYISVNVGSHVEYVDMLQDGAQFKTEISELNKNTNDLGMTCSKWIFKPNFSNKRSSVRRLATTLSRSASRDSEN